MHVTPERLWEWRCFGGPVDTHLLGMSKLPEQTLIDDYLDVHNTSVNIKIRSIESEPVKLKRLVHRCGKHATDLWTVSMFMFPLERDRDLPLLRLIGTGTWPEVLPDVSSFVKSAQAHGARVVRVEKRRRRYEFVSSRLLVDVEVVAITSPIHITSVSLEVAGDVADAELVCRSLLDVRERLGLASLQRLSYSEAIARWE